MRKLPVGILLVSSALMVLVPMNVQTTVAVDPPSTVSTAPFT
jgi:hypothetical protein